MSLQRGWVASTAPPVLQMAFPARKSGLRAALSVIPPGLSKFFKQTPWHLLLPWDCVGVGQLGVTASILFLLVSWTVRLGVLIFPGAQPCQGIDSHRISRKSCCNDQGKEMHWMHSGDGVHILHFHKGTAMETFPILIVPKPQEKGN